MILCVLMLPWHVELAQDDKAEQFEASPQDVMEEATKVLALLKLHTPPDVPAAALPGCPLHARRKPLAEECQDLAKHLVELDPYREKSALESALALWNEQTKQKVFEQSQPADKMHAGETGGLCTETVADGRH